jgi:SecD/SecF fusion protein
MQSKGAIKLLAIALTLVSIYQLSFTWVVNNVKDNAVEQAKGDIHKEKAYLDSVANEGVYNFLWIRNYTFRDCQEREINLRLAL